MSIYWATALGLAVLHAVSMRLVFGLAPEKRWPWTLLGAVYAWGIIPVMITLGVRSQVGEPLEIIVIVLLEVMALAVFLWTTADYYRQGQNVGGAIATDDTDDRSTK